MKGYDIITTIQRQYPLIPTNVMHLCEDSYQQLV